MTQDMYDSIQQALDWRARDANVRDYVPEPGAALVWPMRGVLANDLWLSGFVNGLRGSPYIAEIQGEGRNLVAIVRAAGGE